MGRLRIRGLTALAVTALLSLGAAPTVQAQAGRPAVPFAGAVFTGGGAAPLGPGTFFGPNGAGNSPTEEATQVLLPPGTLKRLRVLVRTGGIPPIQGLAAFQVTVNGDDTALVCVTPANVPVCVSTEEVELSDISLVTLRATNTLLHNNPPVPLSPIAFSYVFELE
jgi:hypothetical protein